MNKSSLTGMFFLLVIFVSFLNASILENIHSENSMYGFQNNYEYAEWQKPSRDSLNMRVIGRALFGSCWQICIKDTLAYTIFGNSLLIFSIADDSNPTLLGYYDEACEPVNYLGGSFDSPDIFVEDSLAYVTGGKLTIFNISDPASIYEVGSCGEGYSFSIVDTLMYILKPSSGFDVINISDPASPVLIGGWIKPGTGYHYMIDIMVKDNIAFVLDYCNHDGGNLSIVDVADPTNPQEIITYNDNNNGTSVFVLDSIVIMGSTVYGFDILNISDPFSPQLLYNGSSLNVIDLFAVDTLLYVAVDVHLGLVSLDIHSISNPSSPQFLSSNSIGSGGYREIQVENDIAYMAGECGGFQILDISDPFNVYELSCYANAGRNQNRVWFNNTGIDINDGIVYMSSMVPSSSDGYRYPLATGLYVLDVTCPQSPSIMGVSHQWPSWSVGGTSDPGYPASAIEVVNEVAFQSQFCGGLVATDVSDPSSPYVINNRFAGLDGICDVDVEDTIAYTAHQWYPNIYDVSDPYSIPTIGILPNIRLIGIEVEDTLAYAVERSGHLIIYNVADAANPQQLYCQNLEAKETFVKDTLLYMARSTIDINPINGLAIYNISDPTSPVEIGFWQKDSFLATDVCVVNNIAFVASPVLVEGSGGTPGIWVLDVSDTSSPVELGYYAGIGPCQIKSDGAYIYASGNGSGLWILEYYGPVAGPVTVSLPAIYASPEDSIKVPVTLSCVTDKEITSTQFTITYDNNIVSLTDIIVDSTTLAYGTDWTMNWDTTSGILTVNMSGSDTLTGVGPLAKIDFFVKPDVYQETSICALHFDNFIFNSGQPDVVTHDGKIIVNIPASIVVSPDSLYFYDGDDVFNHSFCTTPTFHITGNTDDLNIVELNIDKVTSSSLQSSEIHISNIENESAYVSTASPILNKHGYIDRGITDTLSYDNDYFGNARGIVGNLTPDSTETYGYATYFVLSEFGLTPGDTLGGIMIYFGPFNGTDLRLYIWQNAPGELRPASELEPLFVDMNVPSPIEPSWSWTTVFLAENDIKLPDTFWVSICYNRITNPPDWYLGYNSSLPDTHTYGNTGGTCTDWQQQSETFGVRVIMGNLRCPQTAELCIKNEGDFSLDVTDITHTADWVTSVSPTSFKRILSGDSAFVSVFVNATGLDNGIYYDTLHILSNDPSIPDYQVPVVFDVDLLGIEEETNNDKPFAFGLAPIYPNPTAGNVNIQYSIASNTRVSLNIYDVSGRLVRTLVNGFQEQGYYSTTWDSKDSFGNQVSSGIYFYCLKADNYMKMKRMVLVR